MLSLLKFHRNIALAFIRPRLELGGGGSPPAAPDPTATANAQAGANNANAAYNAALNRTNITTPYGNQTWTQNGTDPATGAPLWSQDISVSPNAQTAIDNTLANQAALSGLGTQAVSNVAGAIGQPIDTSNLAGIQAGAFDPGQTTVGSNGPQVGNGLMSGVDTQDLPGYAESVFGGDLDGARTQAQNAIYGRHTAMLDPEYQQRESDLASKLANQGVFQGSEAYDREMGNFARQRDFAYGQARDASITGGNDYAQQQFQQGASNAALQNAARQGYFGEGVANVGLGNEAAQTGWSNFMDSMGFNNQANQQTFQNNVSNANMRNSANQQQLAQMLQLRNQPLNELSAINSGSQVQTPQFQPTPTITSNPVDIASLYGQQYQGQLAGYNANQASRNANTGAIAGVASAALMAF